MYGCNVCKCVCKKYICMGAVVGAGLIIVSTCTGGRECL